MAVDSTETVNVKKLSSVYKIQQTVILGINTMLVTHTHTVLTAIFLDTADRLLNIGSACPGAYLVAVKMAPL